MEHGFVGTNMAVGKHNFMGGNNFVRISMADMVIIVTYCNHSNPIDINHNDMFMFEDNYSQNLIQFLEKQLEMIQLTLEMVDQWDGDGTSPYPPVGTFKNPSTPKKSI